jgi:hypothetical protein
VLACERNEQGAVLQATGLLALRADTAQCTTFVCGFAGLVVYEPPAASDAGPG